MPADTSNPPKGRTPGPEGFAILTRDLTKKYGDFTAVKDASLRIRRGGVIGFVGPNGAGKTTTIRMLLGLIRPTSGSGVVLVGALIESPAFYPMLSGARNLRILALAGGHDLERIPEVLRIVGLGTRAGDRFKSYSMGMKQRLGIAAALLPNPELLILDEPTTGLDPAGILEMRALLRNLGDAGRTVFVSSHLMSEMQRICDDLVIIRRGKIVFQGAVAELVARSTGIEVSLSDPRKEDAFIALCKKAGHTVRTRSGTLFVEAPPDWAPELNRLAMKAGIVLSELHALRGDLEDVVLELTGGHDT
jgi:ABC-2 type transport system ATP-binding protein